MGLNVANGNMYSFVSHTWNVVKGKCPHDCNYCYMKIFDLKPMRFDKNELKSDLGEGNFIFVGSSCDMWAEVNSQWKVHSEWITEILEYCYKYNDNRYLFQSKNPMRFIDFLDIMPDNVTFGTTIETNRRYKEMGFAPEIESRVKALEFLSDKGFYDIMVTIEPIMDFDLDELVGFITRCFPKWVNIGADSKGHHLPEPYKAKIQLLIDSLNEITEVKIKDNLKRLMR